MSDVIAAISTGLVRSAIGILRMSGNGCIEVAERVFRTQSGKPLSQAKTHTLVLGELSDEYGRVIDQCVAVIARAPHS